MMTVHLASSSPCVLSFHAFIHDKRTVRSRCDVSLHLPDDKGVFLVSKMTPAISKPLSISCLLSVEMTQLNGRDTDSNENSETQRI